MSGAPFEFSVACDAAATGPPSPLEIVPEAISSTLSVARERRAIPHGAPKERCSLPWERTTTTRRYTEEKNTPP